MFGFGRSGPTFVVGSSALFVKTKLSPREFGREITRLGFRFGLARYDDYKSAKDNTAVDIRLLGEIARNPGLIQLLFANWATGAFLCHTKVVLRATDEIMAAVELGLIDELRGSMSAMSEQIIENHKMITIQFRSAVEREIRQTEVNASVSVFLHYTRAFYPESGIDSKDQVPKGLVSNLAGRGTVLAAICQDDFRLKLEMPS